MFHEKDKKTISKHGDGNLSFEDIITHSDKLLADNGQLSIILPKAESEIFMTLAEEIFFCNRKINIYPTKLKQISRVFMEFSRYKKPLLESFFSIRDENLQYSNEYLELVDDYLTLRI